MRARIESTVVFAILLPGVVSGGCDSGRVEEQHQPEQTFVLDAPARDPDQMIRTFTEDIRRNPEDPLPYNWRGCVYVVKGEFDKAVADFNKAIQLNPKIGTFYNGRGVARLNMTAPL